MNFTVVPEAPGPLAVRSSRTWLIFCGHAFGLKFCPRAGSRGASIMMTLVRSPQTNRANLVLLTWALGALLIVPAAAVYGQPAKVDVLKIGSTGSLGSLEPEKEKGALETLKEFIKSETGFDNVIDRFPDWREVADKLGQKQSHLGVFAGYEFAWAQEKQPNFKPLAVAVNVYRYPTAHVVTKKDDPATDF